MSIPSATSTFSLLSTYSNREKKNSLPLFQIGSPYDNEGLRWTPIEINIGKEKVEVDAHFHCGSHSSQEATVATIADIEARVISCPGAFQFVIAKAYDTNNRPDSLKAFSNLVEDVLMKLQPSYSKSEVTQDSFESKDLYALEIKIEPETKASYKEKKESHAGCFIKAFGTKNGLYLLIDKSYTGKVDAYAKRFHNSFNLVSS